MYSTRFLSPYKNDQTVFLPYSIFTSIAQPCDYQSSWFHRHVLIEMISAHLASSYCLIPETQIGFLLCCRSVGISCFLFCFRLLLMLISFCWMDLFLGLFGSRMILVCFVDFLMAPRLIVVALYTFIISLNFYIIIKIISHFRRYYFKDLF